MDLPLIEQLLIVRDVIENEHGGKVYDGKEYITIEWRKITQRMVDGMLAQHGLCPETNSLEIMLENT